MSLNNKHKKDFHEKDFLVVSEKSADIGFGGYTRLKDNILYLNTDGKNKVIQIESSVSHECKTTVTANLAVSLGFTDKKVIVIDLDFRRPRTHRMFGVSKEVGIGEYLLGLNNKDEIIKDTEFKNVKIITRGAQVHNPSLVLISDKFKKLIKELREEYDFVLLDCAPILQVSDYIHIGKLSDGVLLLVAYARTTKVQVAESVKELNRNNIKLLGTVFTMYDRKKDLGYSHYNSYYYDYGHDLSDNKD